MKTLFCFSSQHFLRLTSCLVLVMLTLCSYAQLERTVELTAPGTLGDYISREEKYLISKLKIKGDLNGTDIALLRDMLGCDIYGVTTPGVLSELDLKEARIVAGGTAYRIYNDGTEIYTEDDMLGLAIFSNCLGLQKIVLPTSLQAVGRYAFNFCEHLKAVEFQPGVPLLDEYAFQGCFELESVSLPSSVKTIGAFAFFFCSKLSKVNLEEGVDSIAHQAFSFTAQTEQYFPASVRYISPLVFYGSPTKSWIIDSENPYFSAEGHILFNKDKSELKSCLPTGDESFVVPESVRRIGTQSISDENMKRITFGENLEEISYAAISYVPLEEIICRGSVPPVCEVLEGVGPFFAYEDSWYETTKLYVPIGASALYREAEVWKDFKNIVESEDVSVEGHLSDLPVGVRVDGDAVVVTNLPVGEMVRVYTSQGELIESVLANRDEMRIPVRSGHQMYIVQVGSTCLKVVL